MIQVGDIVSLKHNDDTLGILAGQRVMVTAEPDDDNMIRVSLMVTQYIAVEDVEED